MLKNQLRCAPAARQLRRAPRCRGGASSLLRLTQPGATRLPSALDLGGWMRRAAQVLTPCAPAFAPSEFIG
jgi:hypothetical protein